jgi:anti-sigma factor (TIGR02949 family)
MSIIDRIKSLFGGDDMISCEEALRLVHDFTDGELEGVWEARVRAHFEVCRRCYPHLQLETSFRDALRRATSAEVAPTDLKAKVAALLAEAEAEG